MPFLSLLGVALGAASSLAPLPAPRADTTAHPTARIHVTVDSARREVIITAGPYDLVDMSKMGDMSMEDVMEHQPSQLLRFQWPVNGYMRGFRAEAVDARGHQLPSQLLHHMIGVNFDRRQLVYDAVERLFAWGAETDPVKLPSGLGVPLHQGEHLGVYAMWHNESGKDVHGAYMRIILDYIPQSERVTTVMPFYVDVNNHIGGVTTFDIPPGHSSQSYEFELPISGRLIGIGGHLHDYGRDVYLQDAETGKVLARLKAKRDDRGHVLGVGRYIFGFNADALPLAAHHKYRVVAEYDNPTAHSFRDGAMGHINGAFVPDDMSQWPKLDPNDPLIRKDIATLPAMHQMKQALDHSHADAAAHDAAGHSGMDMKMDMPGMDHGAAGGASSMDMDRMPGMHHGRDAGTRPDSSARADSTRRSPRS